MEIDGDWSEWEEITCGVPQESILSILLFRACIKDLLYLTFFFVIRFVKIMDNLISKK